jgi:NAD(P)-dependent dehydrogenase (short-subunit alcohol dehydrogenase family)
MAATTTDPVQLFDVNGRTALITGATGAFGSVAAETLSRSGCNLVLASGNAESLAALAERLQSAGGKVETYNARPTTEEICDTLVDRAVARFGRLDIVVVASGTNQVDLIENLSPGRWDAVMQANVRDPWLVCRAASRVFKQQGTGGKVVLMSSTRGILGHPAGYSAYCPSKSAIDGLARTLGCEWGSHGITVNAIAPTVFRSPLTAWMFEDDDKARKTREGMLARIPLGRLGEPEDLAGPLLFLCSSASDFMTGQVLRVDGGYTAG